MKKRGFVIGTAMPAALALIFTACGEDQGEWTRDNTGPGTMTTVNVPAPIQRRVGTPTLVETTVDPIGDGRTGVTISCKIPESPGVPELLANGFDIHVDGTDDQVCFGRLDEYGANYCQWVAAHERRFRAIADCHKTAVFYLDKLGADMVQGRLSGGETWQDVKSRFVPGAWAVPVEETVAGVGEHSGWVAALMNPDAQSVAPSPFCFKKQPEVTLRDARNGTLAWLWSLWQAREAQMNWVVGSLGRGVRALVNPDNPPIEIVVDVLVVPNKQLDETCRFERR